jgi:hypothetical protein
LSATGHIFGYVTDSKGKPLTPEELTESKAAGVLRKTVTHEQTEQYLEELKREQRIHIDPKTRAIIVPKMVLIGKQRDVAAKFGHKGGNPALRSSQREQERTRAVQDTVEKLWRTAQLSGQNSEDFLATMKACAKEYKTLGRNRDGMDVVGEALEVIKHRKETP